MGNNKIDQNILDRAQLWLDGKYDNETKSKIREMIENNPAELIDAFYKEETFLQQVGGESVPFLKGFHFPTLI